MQVSEARVNVTLLSFYDTPEQRQLLSVYDGPGVEQTLPAIRSQATNFSVCSAPELDVEEWEILRDDRHPGTIGGPESDLITEWRRIQEERALASLTAESS